MAKARQRLETFTEQILAPVGRSERRHWGGVYVRGLLLDGERKSVGAMAERLPEGNEQNLQQFVSQSPWIWEPVWQRLAQQAEQAFPPRAWIVDDTGFPKKGEHSVGVARPYSGTLGKTANCQVAVSLHAASTTGSSPLSFHLYLPQLWAEDGERRQKAGVPDTVTFREKWRLALDLIDQARGWGLAPPPLVLAAAGYGENGVLFGKNWRNGICPTLWASAVKCRCGPPRPSVACRTGVDKAGPPVVSAMASSGRFRSRGSQRPSGSTSGW
jgi:SRSO17 transposase